jgi:hypothetical protein
LKKNCLGSNGLIVFRNNFADGPRLLCFVLHNKSMQTVLAVLHEKDAEDHKEEEDAFIIQTRCHENSKKMKRQEGGAKWLQGLDPLSQSAFIKVLKKVL